MDSVHEEYEKIVKKQRLITTETFAQIDDLIQQLENTKNQIESLSSSTTTSATSSISNNNDHDGNNNVNESTSLMEDTEDNHNRNTDASLLNTVTLLKGSINKKAEHVTETHKELFSATNKFSKWLEKQKYFKTDIDSIWNPGAVEGKESVLDKAIALHFIREGKFSLSDTIKKEARVDLKEKQKSVFVDMFQIAESLKIGDLNPAIEWCVKHHQELQKRGSSLEFQLHRAQYILLLKSLKVKEALMYAKKHFDAFKQNHSKEIQKLMGAVLFLKKMDKCPYKDIFNSHVLQDVQILFTKNFCQVSGFSSESPLYTSVTVGASALPVIMKMASILKDQSGIEWTQDSELAVEIPLLDSHRYHSIFCCPVSKEPATEENPAMMMTCGHVIVKESLNRLSKGNAMARFKCPYCPTESTSAQALQIHF